MFKRLFWLTVGAFLGFGFSFRLTRLVRETVDRYRPRRVATEVPVVLRELGTDVRAAMAEGRQAMREREAELRGKVERRQ